MEGSPQKNHEQQSRDICAIMDNKHQSERKNIRNLDFPPLLCCVCQFLVEETHNSLHIRLYWFCSALLKVAFFSFKWLNKCVQLMQKDSEINLNTFVVLEKVSYNFYFKTKHKQTLLILLAGGCSTSLCPGQAGKEGNTRSRV